MERTPSDLATPTVLKFGGTSVEDAAVCARVAGIVRAHGGSRPVVVVSALAGVTDALLGCVREGALRDFDPHLERHGEIARRLLGPEASAAFLGELERARGELAALMERIGREPALRARLEDEIVSYGERLSAPLVAAVLATAGLRARHVDARRCIVTDESPGRATPDPAATAARTRAELVPLLDGGMIPVLGGYIGASTAGVTTTLGRGGSDYTAALVGAALGAGEIQIWTDVSGVQTADPRVVRGARTIPSLSYAEAAELAYFGAKVLHPKTIQPAKTGGSPCASATPTRPTTRGPSSAARRTCGRARSSRSPTSRGSPSSRSAPPACSAPTGSCAACSRYLTAMSCRWTSWRPRRSASPLPWTMTPASPPSWPSSRRWATCRCSHAAPSSVSWGRACAARPGSRRACSRRSGTSTCRSSLRVPRA